MRRKRRWLVGLLAFGLAILLGFPAVRWWRAAKFLEALAAGPSTPAAKPPARAPHASSPAPSPEPPLIETELALDGAAGPIRARLYRPAAGANGRGIVVAHGVHYQGIDERRLVPFARALARTGLAVLTPELSELADYRITRQGISVIADSVRYLSLRRDVVRAPRVGLLGFSFGGGLSLVAASEAETGKRLAFVTSVGGHHDLGRVLSFLIHNQLSTPTGPKRLQAHDYGLVVLTYGNLGHFVPEGELPVMREAFKSWLHDDRRGALGWASRRTTSASERLWALLESENLRALTQELDALVASQKAELAALSPRGRLRAIPAPVYLLHGAHDNVIPPSEVDWAALELDGADHEALVSPLLDHVQVGHATSFGDAFALVRFMANLL